LPIRAAWHLPEITADLFCIGNPPNPDTIYDEWNKYCA
jgi:hypothetical protein